MTHATPIRPCSGLLRGRMRAYSEAMNAIATAQPTKTSTNQQGAKVSQNTTTRTESRKDVYEAALAIEMTDQRAFDLDPWTAPLIEVRAASAWLSGRSLAQDLDEMFRRVNRREELDGAYWERALGGGDLM